MKILVFTAVGFVGLGLLWGAIGMLLPASRSAVGSREIEAPRARVWQILMEVAAQPAWRSQLDTVEVLDATPGRERWVERPRRGPVISFFTEVRKEPEEWTVRFAGPAEGRWTGKLVELPEGRTRVEVKETSTVSNPWARLLARLVFDPQAVLEGYLEALARAAEQGGG